MAGLQSVVSDLPWLHWTLNPTAFVTEASQPLEHDPRVLPEFSHTPPPVYDHHNEKYPVEIPTVHHHKADCFELSDHVYEEDKKGLVATVTPIATSKSERRICGFRRNIFIGIVITTVLLIAIAGGVVGGVLATRNKSVGLQLHFSRDESLRISSKLRRRLVKGKTSRHKRHQHLHLRTPTMILVAMSRVVGS